MAAIWTEEAKLARWLRVELAVCRAWAERGVIPPEDIAAIEARAGFSVERTREIERTTNHDVAAFVSDVSERIGAAGRWIHHGLTSSDVLDTGLALALRDAGPGLEPEPAATQVVARDRHAALVAEMAVAASSLERLAVELRHLQRTELREAEEAFAAGQKGSSAMPHKRNPITAERISGLS